MKKTYISLLILGLIVVLTLSACTKDVDDSPIVKPPVVAPGENVEEPEDKDEDVVVEDDTIIEEFKEVLDKEAEPEKIISYIDENLDKIDEFQGDIMIDGLERKLQKNLDPLAIKIMDLDKENELMDIDGLEPTFLEAHIKDIKNDELRVVVENAHKNMYKLVNIEGQFYPIIDYSKLQKYNDNLTDEWKDYINIMAMDSDNLPQSDGGLRITFDELAERLMVTEEYLNSYIEGERRGEVLDLYENKINIYLKGSLNTPIEDRDTKVIKPEVLKSYEKTGAIDDYLTSYITLKYLDIVKENNNIIDELVFDEADRLIKEVMEILTEFK